MKSTRYRPKKKKRKNKHGFLKRTGSRLGKKIIRSRKRKGRYRLIP